ncbi:MAG: hypothetical protein ACYDEJ_04415 [Desulfitobacteriaceae bacterium]
MKRKLRIFIVWTLIALFLQFGVYSFLDYQVSKVLAPIDSPIPTKTLEVTIPGVNLENIQISYSKDYLAYKENGIFKVFNLSKGKVVFEKKPVAGSEKNMGVMGYQWLPDRDVLIYFYSKKNPNPVSIVTVQPTKTAITSKSEDNASSDEKQVPQEPRTETHYNNPWLTELYTLELSPSEEDTTPDDRPNITIATYPAGGIITQMVFSTYTNLMYVTVKSGTNMSLMEIDVMKNVRNLNRSGEWISNMSVSDQQGTLYLDSKIGTTKQIAAVKGWDRNVVSKDANDVILGDRKGKLYLGRIKDNQLIKISTRADTTNFNEKVNLVTVWEGAIPYKDARVVIGSLGQIIIYTQQTAHIINNGKDEQVNLHGEENYISPDGAELIELTRQGTSTLVKLQPLAE